MTRRTKVWIVAALVLLAYLALAFVTAKVLKLGGRELVALWILLTLLGLISAGVIIWFFGGRAIGSGAGKLSALEREVDAVIAAANAQLHRAGIAGRAPLKRLPLVVVVGPEGSAKTTSVVRSGMAPELLAGDVFRGETVAPTRTANLWFAKKNVFVEIGGALVEPGAWNRLIGAIRPRSFVAAFTRARQPARLAVVCFSCEEFVKPGSGEAVPAAARMVRERLGEAARRFGVSLPTYVLFTKADAIPHFEAFVRNLTADEAREPLGSAVAPDGGGAGTYADRATTRLTQMIESVFLSLALRRPDFLAREHALEWRPGAYEFPREVRKLEPLAVDFLREVGRPSELHVSPVLRGFYFVGVQAVYVTETTPEYAATPAARAPSTVRSATGVFGADQLAAARPAVPASAQTRKVPRWDFIERLFSEVVLADGAAALLTSGGTRVSFWRRAMLGAAATLGLLLATAFTISYVGNRGMERRAVAAARGVAGLQAMDVDFPTVDALRQLDTLRAQVDTLRAYAEDGAPLHLRWGLYAGNALAPDVRRTYFAGFDKLLFGATRAAMLAALRALPDAPRPADDYGETYGLLRAYLVTTTHPDKSDTSVLAPVLMKYWLSGRTLDSARAELARRQFDTYAAELRLENPYAVTVDATAADHARAFLRQFAGSEQIYQSMLADVAKTNPPLQFNQQFPGSARSIVDAYEVPGPFTKGGWTAMQNAFKSVDRFLQGETWVLGADNAPVDKSKLLADLRSRYSADFANAWRGYLRAAAVVRYSSVKDAADQLTVLSGNQSPLLELLSLASRNTAVSDSTVSKLFQPVQSVMPPGITDKLIAPPNAPYMTALVALQASLDQTANARGTDRETAAAQATSSAAAAKSAVLQIAAGFTIDAQGQLQATVQRLLEDPIANAEPLLKNFGASEINARGRTFCAALRPMLAKFPFTPDATTQASVADLAALLRPTTGELWTLYSDVLQTMLPRQGTQYVPQAGGTTKLSPDFVAFFNRAATLSDALFSQGQDLRFSLTVTPQPSDAADEVALSYDGETIKSARRGKTQTAKLTWPGVGHETKLSATLGSTELTLVGPFTGPWALIQLFYSADTWTPSGDGYRVEWSPRTAGQRMTLPNGSALKIAMDVNAGAATPLLRRGTFAGACSGDIAK
ncbi:MAG TPA: ImcF-related family protein [Gemmatimonadaceae bacterium]|nr:ImcF-related family protein [Gemmatimonadaceae bacterium]